ncbi:MAG: PAS domain-containing protein [Phenylobacterium sp.]
MVSELGASAQAEGAQEALLSYWSGLRRDGRLPSRADIRPEDIKSFLPRISLIEVGEDPRFRVRLAGTGLYDLYGAEITGRTVREAFPGSAADYWRGELEVLLSERRPAIGVHSLGWRGAPHLSILWTRLPLASNGKDVDMILGYDVLLGGDRAGRAVSGIRAA